MNRNRIAALLFAVVCLNVSAADLVIRDQAVVPLHYQVNTWAAHKGYTYAPRTDERTYAHEVKKQ